MSDERILGSSDFAESVLKQANEAYLTKSLAIAKGLNLDKLITLVAEHLEIDQNLLMTSSRQKTVAQARSVVCCLAKDNLMLTGAEVACKLNLTPSAISKLASRGRKDSIGKEIENDIFDLKRQINQSK